jgi:hypothetical protein
MAAVRTGGALVVPKLNRWPGRCRMLVARSLPDACGLAVELTTKVVALNIGGSVFMIEVAPAPEV